MKTFLVLYQRNDRNILQWLSGVDPTSTNPADFFLTDDCKIILVLAGLNMVGAAHLEGKEVRL